MHHLFFNCSYSSELWLAAFTTTGFNPPPNFTDFAAWITLASIPKKTKGIIKLLFQSVVYFLWRERNSRLFTQSSKLSQMILREIHLQIRARLLGLDKEHLSILHPCTLPAGHNSTRDRKTYLSLWFSQFQDRCF